MWRRVATRMNLDSIILSDRSQTQTGHVPNTQGHRDSALVVARGWGRGAGMTDQEYGVSIWGDGNVLELWCWLHNPMKLLKPLHRTLHRVNFTEHELYHYLCVLCVRYKNLLREMKYARGKTRQFTIKVHE